MSRIGNAPITVPSGVDVSIDGRTISVKGPKGQLEREIPGDITMSLEGETLTVARANDENKTKALHGLARSLVNNMVIGVTEGFKKELEIVGVGYRADAKGQGITLNLGFSHPIEYVPAEGVKLECPNQTTVVVTGIDKAKVGQAAAEIRAFRPPEPYKGKGVRYQDEHVRRKAGKTASSGG